MSKNKNNKNNNWMIQNQILILMKFKKTIKMIFNKNNKFKKKNNNQINKKIIYKIQII